MKKFLIPFLALFTTLILLVSCSNNKNTNIEVLNFQSQESEYFPDDSIVFEITFENPSNYKITNVKINNKQYEISLNNSNTTGIVEDAELKYSESKQLYTLNSFTYEYEENGQTKIKDVEVLGKTCIINTKVQQGNDIDFSSFQMSTIKDQYTYGKDDFKISASIEYAKDYFEAGTEIVIRRIYFKIYTCTLTGENLEVNLASEKLISYGIGENLTINENKQSVNFEFNMPNDAINVIKTYGYFKIVPYSIEYTNENKYPGRLLSATAKENTDNNIILEVIAPEFEVLEYRISNIYDEEGITAKFNDIEKNIITEKGNVVETSIRIKRANGIEGSDISYIKINGQIIKPTSKQTTGIYSTAKFKFTISKASKGIEEFRVDVEEIGFENNQVFVYPSKIEPTDNYKKIVVYDVVAQSSNDLLNLSSEDSIFLANDISYTQNTNNILYNNKDYNGVFEGNGKSIIAINIINLNKPMFEEIGENAIIKNLNIRSSNTNCNAIANVNNGTFKNISLSQTSNYSNSNYAKNSSGLFGINNGTIHDLKIERLDFTFKVTSGDTDYSLIADINNGEIKRIVIGDIYGMSNNAGSAEKTNIYMISRENHGTIESLVVESDNLSSITEMAKFVKFTFNFYSAINDGNEGTSYVNELLVNPDYTSSTNNYINLSKDVINVSRASLGIGTIDTLEKSKFYSSLGFMNDGIYNFWNINESGKIVIKY